MKELRASLDGTRYVGVETEGACVARRGTPDSGTAAAVLIVRAHRGAWHSTIGLLAGARERANIDSLFLNPKLFIRAGASFSDRSLNGLRPKPPTIPGGDGTRTLPVRFLP
jgi:hypothetical protein